MKIDLENIYIGNIMRCTKYEERANCVIEDCCGIDTFGHVIEENEVYKENALLLKVAQNGYVDLEQLNSCFDYFKIIKDKTNGGFRLGGLILSMAPWKENDLFVSNVRRYYIEGQKGKVKIKDIKRNRDCKDIEH